MKVEYNLIEDDYIAFNMHHIDTSPTIRRTLLMQQYGVALVFLIIPYFFSRITEIPMLLSYIVYGAIFLAWILYYPKYFISVTKRRIIKMINEGDNSSIYGMQSITLTDTGIEQESHTGESRTAWHAIERIDETEEYIYIYIGTMNAYLVPNRAFEDDAQRAEFLRILREKTGINK